MGRYDPKIYTKAEALDLMKRFENVPGMGMEFWRNKDLFKDEDLCIKVFTESKTTEYRYASLDTVPARCRTGKICLEAVKHHASNIGDVSKQLLTDEMLRIAVSKFMESPTWTARGLVVCGTKGLSRNEMLEMLAKYGLYMLHNSVLTKELLMTAVKHDGSSLSYVPENRKTFDLCAAAVNEAKGKPYFTSVIREIPEKVLVNAFETK